MTRLKSLTNRKYVFPVILLLMNVLISCQQGSGGKAEGAKASAHEDIKTSADSAYIVDVTATDYAFGMPTEVPSGWVTFRMKNMGQVEHNAIIHKYVDTLQYHTLTRLFSEALEGEGMQGFSAMFDVSDKDMGGPAILSPNHTGETTVFLEPGVYTFTCWMVAEDGEYHIQKGMSRPFVVTNKESGAEKPEGTVGITLSDLAIDIEDPIGAGEHVFDVTFEASHNVHLAKLGENQKLEDLQIWMNKVQTPSSFTFLGGAEQAPVGMSSTFKASLEPGRYAFVTYGTADSGMAEEIIVPKEGKSLPVSNEPVNPEVRIESDMKRTILPKTLPTGRTPVVIKNSGEEEYEYLLTFLIQGNSTEDVNRYFKKADFMSNSPYEFIWYGTIEPGEVKRINLEVQERQYMLIGPYLPGAPFQDLWREDNFVHLVEGVRKSNL